MPKRKVGVVRLFSVFVSTTFAQVLAAQMAFASPGAPIFSVKHGFYKNPFDLVITAQTAVAGVRYTLDGSDPRTSPTAIMHSAPDTVRIDPQSTDGDRGIAPAVVVRACAVGQDSSESESVTQSYIFVDEVGALSPEGVAPSTGWPDPNAPVNGQAMHYGVSSAVLNDPRYKDQIDSALLSIPSISIATDLKNLFAADSGIYVNALQDGDAWERPASIELIRPDSVEGFQINAGLRIRGGWSRHGDDPKHAFRLFFRGEYGSSKLSYPLFDTEGVTQFDKVDLRTGQNYAWSYPGHLGLYNTMISEVFCRDLQREMGQPYTRSRFYHLYIDGVYWGLYQTQERSEAHYAASYFGGSSDDYDVVKIDDNYTIEATDGTLDAYLQLWNYCVAGFQSDSSYFKLQGLNPDGTRNSNFKILVDMDNLIDYMIDIFYSGNFDSPTTKFGNDKNPNNFYCIYDRNGTMGFRFFVHDAEHTLRTTSGEGPGIGLFENRVNIGSLSSSDNFKMDVSDFSHFHPQWLHFRLSDNPEYKIRFADHVYKRFFNGGSVTPAKVTAMFQSRAREIQTAIIGESLRWGDTYLNPVATKDDDWLPAINDIVNNYFPQRTGIVLNQLKASYLYPAFDPPAFLNYGQVITSEKLYVGPGYKLTIQKPAADSGIIIYTIDGEDPRSIGGTVSSSAFDSQDEVELTASATMSVKARLLHGTTWSALHEIVLFVDPIYTSVQDRADRVPSTMFLEQNYPNPFNPSTTIKYQLSNVSHVTLRIYDVFGREVKTLVHEIQNAGSHSVTFNATKLANGVYFYRLQAGTQNATKKLLFLK